MPVSSALVADHRRDTDTGGPSDAELIAAVRSGATDAYGELYRRHLDSARALARQLTSCRAKADDLVAEAFTKLFSTLRCGGGPDAAFRAYLLTVLRHTAYDRARQDRKVELSDDMTRHDPGVPWQDTAVDGLESRLAARAFTRLPERWRTVLWRTEVEQESPAEVASMLGLTPNGVSALAYRAREGLRQAYLQEHLSKDVLDPHRGTDGHHATVDRLGSWARGGLSARQRARIDSHLATCPDCLALAAELADVGGGLCREPLAGCRTGIDTGDRRGEERRSTTGRATAPPARRGRCVDRVQAAAVGSG